MTSPSQGDQFEREKNGGVGTTPPPPFQLTSSISFTTLAPGGQESGTPWIQLYSNALHGGTITYPTASQATCTTTYQVLVIDRQTLAEKSYACYDTDAALINALAQFVPIRVWRCRTSSSWERPCFTTLVPSSTRPISAAPTTARVLRPCDRRAT